ncbi:MAG: tRNA (N(6)-L-threonylcarbamoyladenosine(37)-C(2))-methylthiotransferase MtaB [Bacilli bacterium]|nr:tRNA (N(6)-L-threonylcarbamoyladenosine(37)-C(2))-methylthiotransferase MtaB [Bacilli bacterium]
MKFKIITLGCKVNQYESEMMREKLINSNFKETLDNDADIVIINTCSVTNMADAKSRKLIRYSKRENKNAIILVCGCSAENHKEELLDLGIDILIGNNEKSKIVELINNFIKTNEKYVKFYNTRNLEFENMAVDKFSNQTRAYMKIQDGCNNFCAFCIIPFMRGTIRSKDINEAYEEAKTLVKNNHKEIVLTGIHTGSYGTGKDYDLVDLLEKLVTIKGLERIRLSSIEITELNDKFIDFLKNNPKLCNHLHIPLQSGCDKILKLMNRKYDLSYFKEKIAKIREVRDSINISTDVIVGFPNETEQDFLDTVKFCKEIGFSKIHVFPYSKRTGTKASVMDNQLDMSIKRDRARKLIEVSEKLEENYNSLFLNKEVEVLIEEIKDGISIGHTSNYIKVEVKEVLNRNEFYNVIITSIDKDKVIARLI